MSGRRARADRAARVCLLAGFWIPLAVCTWLALTPSPPQAVFRIGDVVLHALAFSYLTFSLGLAHPGQRAPALAAWMLAYGILIEALQSLETARSAELKDLLVDGAGIAVGLALLRSVGGWSRRTLTTLLEYPLGR